MVRVFYSRGSLRNPNTATLSRDDGAIVVRAIVQRTETSSLLEMNFRCRLMIRGEEYAGQTIKRFEAETWMIPAVRFDDGDIDDIWVMSVPSSVGDALV